MSKLTRTITADGSAVAIAVDSTEIAAAVERIHQTSAVVTAALGRLATAGLLMGSLLKGENDSITLRVSGGGPTGQLIVVADSQGNVKASVDNPLVELPLNASGKLDVGSAVGREGFLSVVRDLGMKEPYTGQTPLVSGEIAEDITNYYATSEQVPTVCGLGVLVNPDLSVRAAGGYLIQLLPFADESCIDVIEENVKKAPPVSAMIEQGMSPEEICRLLLNGLNPDVLDESNIAYKCNCSREKVRKILRGIQREELTAMRDEDKGCEVCCHFCNKKYQFSEAELTAILETKPR